MAWLGKVSLANFGDLAGAVNNFGDLAGAVNKLSESVKNIERGFDSALGYEAEPSASASEGKGKDSDQPIEPVVKQNPEVPSTTRPAETVAGAGLPASKEERVETPELKTVEKTLPEKQESGDGEPAEDEGWAHSNIILEDSTGGETGTVLAAKDEPPKGLETGANGEQAQGDASHRSAGERQSLAADGEGVQPVGTAGPEVSKLLDSDARGTSQNDKASVKSSVLETQIQEILPSANGKAAEVEARVETVEGSGYSGVAEGSEGVENGSVTPEEAVQAAASCMIEAAEEVTAVEFPNETAEVAPLGPGHWGAVKIEPSQVEPAQVQPAQDATGNAGDDLEAAQPDVVQSPTSESQSAGPSVTPALEQQPVPEAGLEVDLAVQSAEKSTTGIEADRTQGQVSADQDLPAADKVDVAGEDENGEMGENDRGGWEGEDLGLHDEALVEGRVLDASSQSDVLVPPAVAPDAGVPASQLAAELAKLRADHKQMEVAVQAAARQAQTKADELAQYMSSNDELRSQVQELKMQLEKAKDQDKKAADTELDALREEYQHRLSAAERKVYALTKERDMLKREQSRKSDTSTLLKEKDEIIKQVMAEGEELSKKQAAQELQMKKLRSQIRELEDEKQRLTSRLQVEEARVESIKKDKATTEKALQDNVERGQAELAAQKEFYTAALAEAKEAQAQAEARADSEAKADVDRRLREATERERTLVTNVEELRQALSRTEQQAAFREDMLRRDVDDLEQRCQAAESRHEELMARMPDSTRPLLRQIQAMQESANMRVEALSGVERALNNRLQEAEAKAAAAEERERACTERLTQTLSRMSVMEAQLALLRAEQAQLGRSLEKERTRAAENRQEYLAALETAATQEGRARQLEEELREARARARRELNEERARREALEQEMESERAAMAEYEKRVRAEGRVAAEKAVAAAHGAGDLGSARSNIRRVSSASSGGSVEESVLLAATTDQPFQLSSLQLGYGPPSPFGAAKGMLSAASLEQLEALVRHKEGELASWAARVSALEATRDSLAEELVNTTQQCELLRTEAGSLPGMRAELEALRRRHSSALELMGERDEQVEELRADLQDVKQMYREQIDMLVNQIERLSKDLTVKAS